MQELSGMSEGARDLAMARFRLIQPHLEHKRSLHWVAGDATICFRTTASSPNQQVRRKMDVFD
jgi:putative transposase